ncbi:hypothetical protein [Nocardia vermiculata]|uniref:Uncharacterized protein n=1 Tax=Nocardia vermiculata TaxID=257274 RepID=A0A846Y681_9NOCA|nr:hypothetical protein [Nocardia vermiculata]NKY53835.1 hypothetical protein [Nocardia vermiculata]
MKIRARSGYSAVAALLALLFLAAILDCTGHRADEYPHAVSSTVMAAAPGAAADHLHGIDDHPGDHCDQHTLHCLEQLILPTGTTVAPELWLLLIAVAALAVFATASPRIRVIRGPPSGGLPVASGQAILTEFCICRR